MNTKYTRLETILKKYRNVAVAFSGGCDSTFLLAAAVRVLGKKNVIAVTAVSQTYTSSELAFCRSFTRTNGITHKCIYTNELSNDHFTRNPVNRCFYCKDELFSRLHEIAEKRRMVMADGTTLDDLHDFRPGQKAARIWGVQHPLLDAGLDKNDVRHFSKRLKLPTWNMPAGACLASRIPFGDPITKEKLNRINHAESYLRKLFFTTIRVRTHGDIARIELDKKEIPRLLDARRREKIIRKFKALGYTFVTLDLQGYRTGPFNPQNRIRKTTPKIPNKSKFLNKL